MLETSPGAAKRQFLQAGPLIVQEGRVGWKANHSTLTLLSLSERIMFTSRYDGGFGHLAGLAFTGIIVNSRVVDDLKYSEMNFLKTRLRYTSDYEGRARMEIQAEDLLS